MSPKSRTVLIALAVVGSACWYLLPRASHDVTKSSIFAPSGRYELSYHSQVDLTPNANGGSLGGSVALEGEIQYQVYHSGDLGINIPEATETGGIRLALSIPRCDLFEMSVLGKELTPPGDCNTFFFDWIAVIELDRQGHLVRTWEPRDTKELTGYLVSSLVADLQFSRPVDNASQDSSYRSREEDSIGIADSHYSLEGRGSGQRVLTRTRDSYHKIDAISILVGDNSQRVNGNHVLVANHAGVIVSVLGSQSVHVDNAAGALYYHAESTLKLTRTGEPMSMVSRAGTRYRPIVPKEPRNGDTMEKKLLANRVGPMSSERMLRDLSLYANSGSMPDHNRWLWQVTGLLKLDPKLAQSLIPVFSKGKSKGRALVLDLLIGADTEEAQATLRTILDSDELSVDPRNTLLRQRLGFVKHPSTATREFALRQLVDFPVDDYSDNAMISAYSAGAIASRDDSPLSLEIRGEIRSRLVEATTPESVTHLLTALANARNPSDTETFARYASDDSVSIRAAVADAVGQAKTLEGHALLRELVGDSSSAVQAQSLHSLSEYGLNEEDFLTIADTVSGGRLHPSNERYVLQIALRFQSNAPYSCRLLVEALVSAGLKNNSLLAQANRYLASNQ